jgi:carbohydrate-selective porin OprB
VELYYRMRLNKQFEISPDFQFIRNPGADDSAADVKVYGLRAQATF